MPAQTTIRVNPFHEIQLAEDILPYVEKPQEKDFVLRTLSRKTANGQPLIQGELVVAGHQTLREFPLANEFPVHFRKTYYPTCFHQSPEKEFQSHQEASRLLPLPPPIGWTRTSFRSCFIPGLPYQRLSPFGVEPVERNFQIGEDAPRAALIGLWKTLEDIYYQLVKLHENHRVHGDFFLHNVIVSSTPIGVFLIDFEKSRTREAMPDEAAWETAKGEDLAEVHRQSVFLQCTLGPQPGPLASEAIQRVDELFSSPDLIHRRLAAVHAEPG